jgi:hypothetical protein
MKCIIISSSLSIVYESNNGTINTLNAAKSNKNGENEAYRHKQPNTLSASLDCMVAARWDGKISRGESGRERGDKSVSG